MRRKSCAKCNLDVKVCPFKIVRNLWFRKCNRRSPFGVLTLLRDWVFFSTASRPTLRPTESPIQLGSMASFARDKAMRACSWPLTSINLQKTKFGSYAFTAWCHIKQYSNFIFTLPLQSLRASAFSVPLNWKSAKIWWNCHFVHL
jgi:hypothetical protein